MKTGIFTMKIMKLASPDGYFSIFSLYGLSK